MPKKALSFFKSPGKSCNLAIMLAGYSRESHILRCKDICLTFTYPDRSFKIELAQFFA